MHPQQLDLPPPKNWQDFEDLCHALWEREWNCPTIQKHGRAGQEQRGVDIFGKPDGGSHFHAIQCKLKAGHAGKTGRLTLSEVVSEVKQAKAFRPPLAELIIATTAKADKDVQAFIRKLSARHAKVGLFAVHVFAWSEIIARLSKHDSLLARFYPVASPGSTRLSEQLSETHKEAIAIRGIVEQLLDQKNATLQDRVNLRAEIERLQARNALSDRAMEAFLKDVGETPLGPEMYAEQLRRFATRYQTLVAEAAKPTDLPDSLEADRNHASARIEAGAFDEAEATLALLSEKLRHKRIVQESAFNELSRQQAAVFAQRADLAEARLQYVQAYELFVNAECVLAPKELDLRWRYMTRRANVLLKLGKEFGDNEAIRKAINIFQREALPLAQTLDAETLGITYNDLGNAHSGLGERESGTAQLQSAVTAYREALKSLLRSKYPLQWARTQNNLGAALRLLGERDKELDKIKDAIAAFDEALKERTPGGDPSGWVNTMNNLGNALGRLGERTGDIRHFVRSATAFRNALQVSSRHDDPTIWALLKNNFGNTLKNLGQREQGPATLQQAVSAFEDALLERTRERGPVEWAVTQNNLGNALHALGDRTHNAALLLRAVGAYHSATEELSRERTPLAWAMVQHNLGGTLRSLSNHETGTTRTKFLETAIECYGQALRVRTEERAPFEFAATHFQLGEALRTLGEETGVIAHLEESISSLKAAVQGFQAAKAESLIEAATASLRLSVLLREGS